LDTGSQITINPGTGGAIWDRYITMTPRQFRAASGIGNTLLYDLIRRGEIDSITIGRRRLIVVESYRRLIERARSTPAEVPTASSPTSRRRTREPG
jgi:hypothetical protein